MLINDMKVYAMTSDILGIFNYSLRVTKCMWAGFFLDKYLCVAGNISIDSLRFRIYNVQICTKISASMYFGFCKIRITFEIILS